MLLFSRTKLDYMKFRDDEINITGHTYGDITSLKPRHNMHTIL